MNRFRRIVHGLSIGSKLIVALIVVEFAALGLMVWEDYLTDVHRSEGEFQARLVQERPIFNAALAPLVAPARAGELERTMRELSATANLRYLVVKDLRGRVIGDANGGRLTILPGRMALGFPDVFDAAFDGISIAGPLDFHYGANGFALHSGLLNVAAGDVSVGGRFALRWPKDSSLRTLTLLLEATNGRAEATPRYLPKTLAPNLRNWLVQAIGAGRVPRGGADCERTRRSTAQSPNKPSRPPTQSLAPARKSSPPDKSAKLPTQSPVRMSSTRRPSIRPAQSARTGSCR